MFDQKSVFVFCFLFFVFLPFSQTISIFSKIWYKKWIFWLISIPDMYTFIYITIIVWNLQHSICFQKKKKNGFTPPPSCSITGTQLFPSISLYNYKSSGFMVTFKLKVLSLMNPCTCILLVLVSTLVSFSM